MKLNLTKDLVIFDVETTGVSVFADKIVQIAILKVFADGRPNISKCRFVNPECHIPEAATKIHHITDEMVKDSPTFKQIAKGLLNLIGDADFLTYNGNMSGNFYTPILRDNIALEIWNDTTIAAPSGVLYNVNISQALSPNSIRTGQFGYQRQSYLFLLMNDLINKKYFGFINAIQALNINVIY